MTKPTVLILVVVYLASILIVGVFGMQIMSFNNVNYIESITLSEDRIDVGNAKKLFEEEYVEEGTPYWKYNLTVQYKEGLQIIINPKITAQNHEEDASNPKLKVVVSYQEGLEGCITYNEDDNVFTVNKKGVMYVTYWAQDNSDQKMVLTIKTK